MTLRAWLALPILLLVASPASATLLRVEWQGVATHHSYPTFDDQGEFVGYVTDPIELAVHGMFEIDLHPLRHGSPPAYELPGGGYQWIAPPDLRSWTIAFEEPASERLTQVLTSYDGSCLALYTLEWAGETPGPLFFEGLLDPEAGRVRLAADGTGDWAVDGVYPANDFEVEHIRGDVHRATVTAIPEPTAATLFGLGAGLVATAASRRRG